VSTGGLDLDDVLPADPRRRAAVRRAAGDPAAEVVVDPEPVQRRRDDLEVAVLHRQRGAGGLEVGDDVVG
jgi:hypothetical protein